MMNKIFLFITLTILVFGFSKCKNDDNSSDPATSDIVQKGTWIVTLYNSDGSIETSLFTGYSFTFNTGGTVTATINSFSVNGAWDTGTDDSQNKFNLDFGSVSPLEELNEDWHIIEKTSSKIRLEHLSGGNGGTDLLIFEKN